MRSYAQYCGIAKALDVLGQRWTPLILRELLLGPRRYSELQRALPGITSNLLASRVRRLKAEGILEQVRRPSDGRQAWALTEVGAAAKPALLALGAFGARWMTEPGDDTVNGRWFVVSLQRRYRGDADLRDRVDSAVIGLEVDGEPYTLRFEDGELVSRDGWPEDPQLVVRGSLPHVVSTLLGPASGEGCGEVEGSEELLEVLRDGLGASSAERKRPG